MLKGFKEFMLKGNVIDLAVAVVMGAAFGNVVSALVKDLITPFIAALVGKPSFEHLQFTINNSVFLYGDFLNAIISFLLVGGAVYFFIVVPMKAVLDRSRKPHPEAAPTAKKCPECLSDIPLEARRCAYCTSTLSAAAGRW